MIHESKVEDQKYIFSNSSERIIIKQFLPSELLPRLGKQRAAPGFPVCHEFLFLIGAGLAFISLEMPVRVKEVGEMDQNGNNLPLYKQTS